MRVARDSSLTSLTKYKAVFSYAGGKIPFYFWANQSAGTAPDAVLFLGTGQVGRIPKWVAEASPGGVVVVGGLPHWQSDPSGRDLLEFSYAYAQCAYEAVLKTFGLQAMHIIGESQSTPGTIWLSNRFPARVRNVALLLPMGLNIGSFGKTDRERFAELCKRSLRTFMQVEQSLLYDIRNAYIAATLFIVLISGIRDGSTVRKYTKGISKDMTDEFRALVNQKKYRHCVTLFLGEKDRLFPAGEVTRALKHAAINNVHIEIVADASHSSLAIRASKLLLLQAVSTVRAGQKS